MAKSTQWWEDKIKRSAVMADNYRKSSDKRRAFARQAEIFTQMLLKEGRTTTEELKKYFPRKSLEK